MSTKLKGQYGFPVAVSLVVGIVIGIGIFFKTSQILLATELDTSAAIVAWILGGVISILSGLTVAEVGAAIPETGGMFAWIRKIYGNKLAFLVGWALALIYNPALIALIAYYFAYFSMQLLGITGNLMAHIGISFGALIFVYLINIYTKNFGGKLQTIVTVAKIVPIALIIIFGFLHTSSPELTESTSVVVSDKSFLLLVGTALLPIMFALDGWIYVGTIAGDLKNPKRDLPRAIVFGIAFISLVYILLNLALFHVYSPEILVDKGIFGVANEVFGNIGSKFIYVGIVISAFGGLNGFILVSTRVPYSLSVEDLFPKSGYFKQLSEKTSQPMRSSYLMMGISLAYLVAMFATGEIDAFGDVPIALIWVFYTLVFIGVFVLRKKYPEMERPYKVPLYPIVPILAIVGGLFVGVSALISHPWYFVLSIAVTLSGLFFYKQK